MAKIDQFIELTRTDEVEGLTTKTTINADKITLIRCNTDGSARIYFDTYPFLSQYFDPVETYEQIKTMLSTMVTL